MKYQVFDSHCDTATELWFKNQTLDHTSCEVSLPQLEMFPGAGQYFSFCVMSGVDMGFSCEDLFWKPYHNFMALLDQVSSRVSLCRKGSEYDQAVNAGKTAVYLSLEGSEGISCDPGKLELLKEAGISMVNLTWNADNALAGCSKYDGPGLSAQGKEFVRKAQQLGIVIDVSHASERTFWDVMDITQKPIVASHSNSRALCNHHRNLTDEQFKVLCECGGYAGINMYSVFLSESAEATLETVYQHMDHFLQLYGEHVALGGDLDGCESLPIGFRGIKDYEKLSILLEEKGFSEETIQNIFSNTMKKVVTLCTM